MLALRLRDGGNHGCGGHGKFTAVERVLPSLVPSRAANSTDVARESVVAHAARVLDTDDKLEFSHKRAARRARAWRTNQMYL